MAKLVCLYHISSRMDDQLTVTIYYYTSCFLKKKFVFLLLTLPQYVRLVLSALFEYKRSPRLCFYKEQFRIEVYFLGHPICIPVSEPKGRIIEESLLKSSGIQKKHDTITHFSISEPDIHHNIKWECLYHNSSIHIPK